MRHGALVTWHLALALAALSLTLVAGQQSPAFRSGVEIVLIDVNVVDRAHVPVGDLTETDFIVSVDHKPRRVASAQFVRYDVRTASARDKNTVPAPRATARSHTAPARSVLIVIDVDSLESGDGMLLRREAASFIDHLAPDDRIGVVTIPRLARTVRMTTVREEARVALASVITGSERYRSMKYNIGLWEAFEAEYDTAVLRDIQSRNCRGDRACADELVGEVRFMRLQERLRGERSLEALRDLGVGLRTLEGPKTVVLVSGGTPPPDRMSNTWFALVAESFVAAQVSLYTLYIEAPFAQAKFGGVVASTAAKDRLVEREGLERATLASGGVLMESLGTFEQYFDRIITELSGSYLLGVEVEPADHDGRPHNVSVSVKRRGVDVRARTQYEIPTDKPRR